jgi:hypothetical protein
MRTDRQAGVAKLTDLSFLLLCTSVNLNVVRYMNNMGWGRFYLRRGC